MKSEDSCGCGGQLLRGPMAGLRPRRFKGPNSSRGLEVEKCIGNVVARQTSPAHL